MPSGSFGADVGPDGFTALLAPAGFGLLAADIVTLPFGDVLDPTLLELEVGRDTAVPGFEATLPAGRTPAVLGGFAALAAAGFGLAG